MPIFIKYMHIYSVSLPSSNACWVLVIGLKLDLTVFFLFAAEALAAQVSQKTMTRDWFTLLLPTSERYLLTLLLKLLLRLMNLVSFSSIFFTMWFKSFIDTQLQEEFTNNMLLHCRSGFSSSSTEGSRKICRELHVQPPLP